MYDSLNNVTKIRAALQQEGVWYHALVNSSTAYWNFTDTRQYDGSLCIDSLKKAFKLIIRRHSILRSNFRMEEDGPYQLITDSVDIEEFFTHLNLKGSHIDLREDLIVSKIAEEKKYEFDFENECLVRLIVLEFTDTSYLILTVNHILTDSVSIQIFWDELEQIHQGILTNNPAQLIPNPKQYFEYCIEYIAFKKTEDYSRQKEFWSNKFSSVLTDCDLSLHKTKNYVTLNFKEIDISNRLINDIRIFSQREKVAYSSIFLLAFFVLLQKYSLKNKIAIGNVTSCRSANQKSYSSTMGLFTNILVSVLEFQEGETLLSFLKKVNSDLIDSKLNNEIVYQDVLRDFNKRNKSVPIPLFNHVFNMIKASDIVPNTSQKFQKTKCKDSHREISFNGIGLTILENGSNTQLRLAVNCDDFYMPVIDFLLENYLKILNECVYNSTGSIAQLDLFLQGKELSLLHDTFNDTALDYTNDKTVVDLFEEQVRQNPGHTALVVEETKMSYRELNEKANQLARYIKERNNIEADSLVGILLDRNKWQIISILAVLKTGGAYVPIDPSYPEIRKKYIIQNSGIKLLLTNTNHLLDIEYYEGNLFMVDIEFEEGFYPSNDAPSTRSLNDLMYVIYTSGSTGKPKGVMVEHRGVSNLVFAEKKRFGISLKTKILQFAPYVFDASVWEIFSALAFGAELLIAPKIVRQDTRLLSKFIQTHQVNIITLPPALLLLMPYKEFPNLKTIIVAGDTCPIDLMKKWGQGRNFINAYGPTEVTVCATMNKYEDGDLSINIGRPIDNCQIYILDSNLYLLPIGAVGEICVGGAGLARGYLNLPRLTLERFVVDPSSEEVGSRIYRTGDRGRWLPDGTIEFWGRIDDQVKVRGFRIELGEIESTVHQSGLVEQCIVKTTEDSGGNKRLVGYVVPKGVFNKDAIISYLKDHMPNYMIPNVWASLQTLPLTTNGKVDKKALPEVDVRGHCNDQYVAPNNETEFALSDIWQELFGVKNIGIHDNFFAMGADSYMVIKLIVNIKMKFNLEIQIKTIFQFPTISGLGTYIKIGSENNSNKRSIKNTSFYQGATEKKYSTKL